MALLKKHFPLWSPAIIAVVVVVLISFAHVGSDAAETKTGTIRLDFIIGGKHAPWFVALEKGFYAKRGLTATIQAGSGSRTQCGPSLREAPTSDSPTCPPRLLLERAERQC